MGMAMAELGPSVSNKKSKGVHEVFAVWIKITLRYVCSGKNGPIRRSGRWGKNDAFQLYFNILMRYIEDV
jgi:hypothetical protein